MRVAIVGTGISGLVAADLLHPEHEVTLFEASDRVGGHTNTVEVDGLSIDTGFIVYNERTYPLFTALLRRLAIATQPTTMGFSVHCDRTGLEYNGTNLDGLFAQRRNLLRPSFLRMIREIFRFNREAPRLLDTPAADATLGELLERGRYGRSFRDHYLLPMGAAIWSVPPGELLDFPAGFFVRFFHNHGMLSVNDRPQWRVVSGGSRYYVEALSHPFRERIRLRQPVREIRRLPGEVTVDGERFDEVLLACHSDQALALLADPSPEEREILGAIAYQPNEAVLHTDVSLLPRRRAAWAAWNYHIPREAQGCVAVTYHMNALQSLDAPRPYCVTLNRSEAIDPALVLRRIRYHHPVFTRAALSAQRRHAEISGVRHTHFAGAYWGYGFHEDGVRSAHAAVARIGVPA